MEPVRAHLEELGRFVADQSDQASETRDVLIEVEERLAQHRMRFVSDRPRPVLVGTAAAAALCAAAFFLALGLRPEPITHQVTRASEVTGGWIETHREPARLDFSEGTSVAVHPETRLRVSESRDNGATVVLERGRIAARVEHPDADRDWRFHAGPYLVQVTGTEFDASWDATRSLFELVLHDGSVIVTGPNLGTDRVVRAGDVLRVSALAQAEQEPELKEDASSTTREDGENGPSLSEEASSSPGWVAPAARGPMSEQVPKASDEPTQIGPEQKHSDARSGQEPMWRKALHEGRQTQVVEEVLRAGAPSTLRLATADELWKIADAARVGGEPLLAQAALLRLRDHYGARGPSAYLLGKIAVDQRRAHSDAIHWFKTYLREYPSGPLSEQALGRLVELTSGSTEGENWAREYLKRFPSGAYVPFARSQLAPRTP